MLWLDITLVSVSVGLALIFVSPLARLLGVYAPTKLVESGYVLGMYGRPTWRFWALSTVFFATHTAWNIEKQHYLMGAGWAVMTLVYVVFTIQAAWQPKDAPLEAGAEAPGDAA